MIPSIGRDATLAGLVTLLVVVIVSVAPAPGASRFDGASHDFAHVVVFGILGLVLARTLRRVAAQRVENQPVATQRNTARWLGLAPVALITLALGIAFGIFTEFAQRYLGGIASWSDVARDALGTALGVCAAMALERPTAPTTRRLLWAAVVAGGIAAAVPLANTVLDYRARDAAFPLLLDAPAARSTAFVTDLGRNVALRTLPPPLATAATTPAFAVALDRGPWPGVTLTEPSPDWRGWRALVVELANPGAQPLTVVVRVNDRAHDNRHADRFNAERVLPPRTRTRLEFPLDAIERAPDRRRMDLATIDKIVVFHAGPAAGQQFYLERMRLVR